MTISINGTSGIVNDAADLNYTGTLTGGTGVVNLGSGQVYKNASGNVGIGTSSPGYSLEVNRAGGGFRVRDGSAGNDVVIQTAAGPISLIGSTANTAIGFTTNNTERARIDSSGNLLVGTTGSTAVGYLLNASGFLQHCRPSGAAQSMTGFYNGGNVVGEIRTSTTATSYITSSDYRLKENIAPMTGALAKVAALKPVTYSWKSNGSETDGFIAHELAEVCPNAVAGEKDAVDADGNPQYQGIDTSFLVATLTAAIQEQQTLITALTARITALEGAAA